MKIYPGKHLINSADSVNSDEDIALGYFDTEFIDSTVSMTINDEYATGTKKEILPYSTIDSLDIVLYDENGLPLSSEEQMDAIVRDMNRNSYRYIPKKSVMFEPYTFEYSVLAKKNMEYVSSRKYNIKAGCADETLSNKLIQFFADSHSRGMCPTNIMFNSGNMQPSSLIDTDLNNIDFLFIKNTDGTSYDKDKKEMIDIEELMKNNVIPWIICDYLPGTKEEDYEQNKELSFGLSKSTALKSNSYMSKYYFTYPVSETGVVFHKIFLYRDDVAPIVIKEYVNKGFVIYCHSDFMDRASEVYEMFYDIIMYVYLLGYVSTPYITEWIADVMPDYIVQNSRLIQKDKFTSNMELHKLLGLREGDVSPINVDIVQPEDETVVYYTGMSSNYLVFKKLLNTSYADPVKASNQMSIFTESNNILFFDNFIYSIQESISDKISYSLNNDTLTVRVQPFKSTVLNTRNFIIPVETTYKLDDLALSQSISLVWNLNKKNIELTNKASNQHILLSTFFISREKKDSKLYDMRRRGGGVSDSKQNLDCLDIGNIMGRPYRKGGALITTVTLPAKYKPQRDEIYNIINNALSKNMVAEDFLVIDLQFN